MLSTRHPKAASSALLPTLLLVSACGGLAGSPPRADLKALTEQKPAPTDDIATDPAAEARYNVAVETWGDRLSSAGARLCRFFAAQGAKDLDCPEPKLSGE